LANFLNKELKTGEDVKTEGAALPEEKGIEVNDYYMDETE
jgi:hypothetical protein